MLVDFFLRECLKVSTRKAALAPNLRALFLTRGGLQKSAIDLIWDWIVQWK